MIYQQGTKDQKSTAGPDPALGLAPDATAAADLAAHENIDLDTTQQQLSQRIWAVIVEIQLYVTQGNIGTSIIDELTKPSHISSAYSVLIGQFISLLLIQQLNGLSKMVGSTKASTVKSVEVHRSYTLPYPINIVGRSRSIIALTQQLPIVTSIA